MPTKERLRATLRKKLAEVVTGVNQALAGTDLEPLEPVLKRIGRGGKLPHWYAGLKKDGTLPNMDGKTVGSVIEILLVAVLETSTFKGLRAPALRISPARGIDLPDLDLGVKSPSKNYCTSEPFFSAYERLLGSDHDVLVLITDYQEAKKTKRPLKLKIISSRYLTKTEVADRNLCRIARSHRYWLAEQDEARAKRVFRFLAYVNQSDWRAKRLLRLVDNIQDDDALRTVIKTAVAEFKNTNDERAAKDQLPIPSEELQAIQNILKVTPLAFGVIDAAENWLMETRKDSARAPNDDEWRRILASPLDGLIGMSLALQWRYNFKTLFGVEKEEEEEEREVGDE